jgi:hypothetical protein
MMIRPFPFRPRVAVIVPGATRSFPVVTRPHPMLAVRDSRRPSTVAQLRRRIRARLARRG